MPRPGLLIALLCCLLPQACAHPTPGPSPLPGFQGALLYRVALGSALQRQQLTLAASLHAMFSHPVKVASVEVVNRGIWVTPRDSSIRAELQPALVKAMGDAYQVRSTRGKNLLVTRSKAGRKRVSAALLQETAAAVSERLASVAPGHKVSTRGGRSLQINLTSAKQVHPVRQLLGQRGDLSLHLVETGTSAHAARTRFQQRVAGRFVLQRQPALMAKQLDGARLERGDDTKTTSLTLDLTEAGKSRLVEVSEAYGGRKLAVLLDGEVLATTLLTDPPKDPASLTGRLRGRVTEARLERLSRILESALLHGPLPAALTEL